MKKRLTAWVFIILLPLISVSILLSAQADDLYALAQSLPFPEETAAVSEDLIRDCFPNAQRFRDLYIELKVTGGARLFGDLILVENGLVEKLTPSSDTMIRRQNTNAILSFVEEGDTSAYLMLLPTAGAVCQDRLPQYMSIYNEKEYLESIGRQVSGQLNYVDVYLPLLYANEQYLYFRTDPRLTSLGQYTVYQTLASRLGFSPRGMGQFSLCRVPDEYYGPLYDRWGYGGIKGDVVTYYQSVSSGRFYTVTHRDGDQTQVYHTLFPTQAAVEGNLTAVILGGSSPMIEITAQGADSAPSLLMLGDEKTLGVLPFLAQHYQRITFCDFSLMTDEEIASVSADGYDHLLFAYSLDTYLNSVAPAKIALLDNSADL